MRIVPDTNLLTSAEISAQGASGQLLDRVLDVHDVILSNPILDELTDVLSSKFGYDNLRISRVISHILANAEIVEPVTFETQICRDPDDDAILGTAVAGNADCIVTGDNDLLIIGRFQGVDIISPSEFARYETGQF